MGNVESDTSNNQIKYEDILNRNKKNLQYQKNLINKYSNELNIKNNTINILKHNLNQYQNNQQQK